MSTASPFRPALPDMPDRDAGHGLVSSDSSSPSLPNGETVFPFVTRRVVRVVSPSASVHSRMFGRESVRNTDNCTRSSPPCGRPPFSRRVSSARVCLPIIWGLGHGVNLLPLYTAPLYSRAQSPGERERPAGYRPPLPALPPTTFFIPVASTPPACSALPDRIRLPPSRSPGALGRLRGVTGFIL